MATLEAISKTSERARERAWGVRGALAPRVETEHGAALICALMGMTILMALGAALVAITSTETIIAGNFRNSTPEALYAAEAAAELAVAELRTRTHWIGVVEGTERSQFIDGAPGGVRGLPTDAPVDLTAVVNIANCGAPAPCVDAPALAAFRLRAPSGSGACRAPPTCRSTSWRSSPGARQNRARPSSRFGARPSVRAGPTRPSKSPRMVWRSRRRADRLRLTRGWRKTGLPRLLPEVGVLREANFNCTRSVGVSLQPGAVGSRLAVGAARAVRPIPCARMAFEPIFLLDSHASPHSGTLDDRRGGAGKRAGCRTDPCRRREKGRRTPQDREAVGQDVHEQGSRHAATRHAVPSAGQASRLD